MWSLRAALSSQGLMTYRDAASHYLDARNLLLRGVVAQLVAFALCEDLQKSRIAVRDPMAEGKAANEDGDTCKDGIEKIEGPHCANTNEVEQRAFDTQVGERLMQALEDSICALVLLSLVGHKFFFKDGAGLLGKGAIPPRANSGHLRREQRCPFRRQPRPGPSLRRAPRARSRSLRSRLRPDSQPSQWCR